MGLITPDVGQLRREREARLRPFLRSRAERLADPSGVKATTYEIAAALWVAEGNLALAQRLLITATGVNLTPRYLSQRVRRCPKLSAFVGKLRLKSYYWSNGRCCPNCGEALPTKPRSRSHERAQDR